MKNTFRKMGMAIMTSAIIITAAVPVTAATNANCGHSVIMETYFQTVSDTTSTHKYPKVIVGADGTRTYTSANCSKRVWKYVNKYYCNNCGKTTGYSAPKSVEFHSACGQ